MRVGITGISGLIGSALAKQLRAGGVEVVGYSRSKRSLDFADEMRPYPELDLRGVDVMVHLAGESVLGFWTEEKKQRILSSRVDGTRAVVDAMRKLDEAERPRGLVCASAIGYYGDRGDELLTETSEPGEGYLADVVRAWEAEAMRAEDDGVRVVRGRIGVVLAETHQAAKSVIEAFRGLDANILVQEFIKEAGGEDIRCFVIEDKVIAAMKRKGAPGEFRSNLHRGGAAETIKLSPEERNTAIQAAKAMDLKVAGVDMLRSNHGPLIMEVNSSPGLEGIERATEVDVADAIVRFLEKQVASGKGRDRKQI